MHVLFSYGSEAAGWSYPHALPSVWSFYVGVVLTLVALGIVMAGLTLVKKGRHLSAVLFSLVAFFFLELLLRTLYPFSFSSIIESSMANSFYTTALQHPNFRGLLLEFDATAAGLPLHATSNMPAKIAFYHVLLSLTSSTTCMGIIITALALLNAVLAYGIIWNISKNRLAAYNALCFTACAPASIYFLPILNVLSPLPILAALFFLTWMKPKMNLLCGLGLGLSVFAAILFDPLVLAAGPLLLAGAWFRFQNRDKKSEDVTEFLTVAGLAFMTYYFALFLFAGFDTYRTLLRVMGTTMGFNDQLRSYWLWLFWNLHDFFLGTGVLSALAMIGFGLALIFARYKPRAIISKKFLKIYQKEAYLPLFVAAFFVSLLLLDVLGLIRGENVRLWIFLMLPMHMLVGWITSKLDRRVFLTIFGCGVLVTALTLDAVGFVIP